MSVYLYACLPVFFIYLYHCLSICLFVLVCTCLCACLSICVSGIQIVSVYLTSLSLYLSGFLHVYRGYMCACLHVCLSTGLSMQVYVGPAVSVQACLSALSALRNPNSPELHLRSVLFFFLLSRMYSGTDVRTHACTHTHTHAVLS